MPGGRPSKLTTQARAVIIEAIKAGCSNVTAFRAAGIGESTFYRWLTDDRKEFREFREELEGARQAGCAEAANTWHSAAKVNWRAAKAWLEARGGDEWKPKAQRIEHAGPPTPEDPERPGPIQLEQTERVVFVNPDDLPVDVLERVLAEDDAHQG